jgi:hypothetical protein
MVVGAVNDGDLHGRAFERSRAGQSSEPGAYDYNMRNVPAH